MLPLLISGYLPLESVSAQVPQADIHFYTKGDVSNLSVLQPLTIPEPAKAESVFDAAYGTTVVKVADANEFPSDESGGIVRPVYSRWRIDNSAGDLFYLVKDGETPLGSGKGQMVIYYSGNNSIYKIVTAQEGLELSEYRWDYSGSKPYTMYYVDGPRFMEYNVNTDQTILIRDFSGDFQGAARILNDVEGDSSSDSRYWAWMVQGEYNGEFYPMQAIIAYDKQTNTILGILDYTKYKSMGGTDSALPRPNMVDVSPLGDKVVVLWGRTDKLDAFDGPHAYNLDFSDPVKVSNDETHSGWAFDGNGDEVYVSQINNANWDQAPADTIAYVNVRTGKVEPILFLEDMGWDMGGMHLGRFYNQVIRGWVYITTYSESNSQSPLRNTAFMLEIKPFSDHPRIWRISSTHNNYSPDDPLSYEKEAYSPISKDGQTIYWGADWQGGDHTVDTYKVQLPQNWWITLRENDTNLPLSDFSIAQTPQPTEGYSFSSLLIPLTAVAVVAFAVLGVFLIIRKR